LPKGAVPEALELTTGLKVLLWVEMIVYGLLGIFETFDDLLPKGQIWNKPFVQDSIYVKTTYKAMIKMHGAICFMLGYIALNAYLAGEMSPFDFEFNFIVLGLIMAAVWESMLPGQMYWIVVCLKPEFWITIALWVNYTDMVRPSILYLNAFLNVYGIFVRFSGPCTKHPAYYEPFTYETLRKSVFEADPEAVEKFDKIAGYKGEPVLPEEMKE
jgi:hypothetical protein